VDARNSSRVLCQLGLRAPLMAGVTRPMRDRTQLKIADRIRLLRIPQGDLEQRKRELRAGAEDAGWTVSAS
jgi:hypothetical protein